MKGSAEPEPSEACAEDAPDEDPLEGFPATLDELIRHPDFTPFGSSSDDWISDPDRMSRISDAAEHGGDGSTHGEAIQDWRDFLSDLHRDYARRIFGEEGEETLEERLDKLEADLHRELDELEAWHLAAGSLDRQIG